MIGSPRISAEAILHDRHAMPHRARNWEGGKDLKASRSPPGSGSRATTEIPTNAHPVIWRRRAAGKKSPAQHLLSLVRPASRCASLGAGRYAGVLSLPKTQSGTAGKRIA